MFLNASKIHSRSPYHKKHFLRCRGITSENLSGFTIKIVSSVAYADRLGLLSHKAARDSETVLQRIAAYVINRCEYKYHKRTTTT